LCGKRKYERKAAQKRFSAAVFSLIIECITVYKSDFYTYFFIVPVKMKSSVQIFFFLAGINKVEKTATTSAAIKVVSLAGIPFCV
jgi:hypothetical protein